MFFLFIFESIGTSELILIGLVALIVLGPRKLPQMARTFGKTMADLRRSTNEFKETWEREVKFEDEKNEINKSNIYEQENSYILENSIGRNQNGEQNNIVSPAIREIDEKRFAGNFSQGKPQIIEKSETEKTSSDKQDWL